LVDLEPQAFRESWLRTALIEQGARDLVVVNNNAGNGVHGLAALLKAGRIRKLFAATHVKQTHMCLTSSTCQKD
jgi:acyl CoA:acetate/3-ketoacid CoA transferase alpha subunit